MFALKEPFVPIYQVAMSVPVRLVFEVTLNRKRAVSMLTNVVKQINVNNFAVQTQIVLTLLVIISVNALKGTQVMQGSHVQVSP